MRGTAPGRRLLRNLLLTGGRILVIDLTFALIFIAILSGLVMFVGLPLVLVFGAPEGGPALHESITTTLGYFLPVLGIFLASTLAANRLWPLARRPAGLRAFHGLCSIVAVWLGICGAAALLRGHLSEPVERLLGLLVMGWLLANPALCVHYILNRARPSSPDA